MEIVQIGNEDSLLRRVPTWAPNYIKPDGSLTSFAFSPSKEDKKPDRDELSVDLKHLTTYSKSIGNPSLFKLATIQVANVKSIDGLNAEHSPVEDNYAHSLIVGKITGSKQKKLAAFANVIPDNEIDDSEATHNTVQLNLFPSSSSVTSQFVWAAQKTLFYFRQSLLWLRSFFD